LNEKAWKNIEFLGLLVQEPWCSQVAQNRTSL